MRQHSTSELCYEKTPLGHTSTLLQAVPPVDPPAFPPGGAENPRATVRKKAPQVLGLRGLTASRGDGTPIELFLEGVRVWEPGIRRLLNANAVSGD
jgi:hypothetical protein